MANNYSEWSDHLTLRNKEEFDWFKSIIDPDIDDVNGPEIAKFLKSNFDINVNEYEAENWPGFEFEFDSNGVSLYAEEYGNLENLATIVKAFLTKFHPTGYFSVSWADTCSKPRYGEFGGGAVFITANNIKWMDTGSWIEECIKNHKI